jgi:hypothetical protein
MAWNYLSTGTTLQFSIYVGGLQYQRTLSKNVGHSVGPYRNNSVYVHRFCSVSADNICKV